jgi:ABC-2 type transport system permease protein
VSGLTTIASHALQEAVRRRVVTVVSALTCLLGVLYVVVAWVAFGATEVGRGTLDQQSFTGATLLGLAMFATLFLGGVLAVFLTLSAVRGDAERGLLQPLVVRPVGRRTYLVGRFLAAGSVCALYVAVVYAGAVVVTGLVGGWWPDDAILPGLGLMGGVVVLVALSLLGSTLLSTTANGIAVFMLFGGGMTTGLLGQIGQATGSSTLHRIAEVASWLLPFEALYQAGLHALTAGTSGITGVIVKLGPFGGAEAAGAWIVPWSVGYVLLVGAFADRVFARQDL